MSEKIIAKVVDRAQAAIDPAEGIAAVSDPGFGGIDVFIGKVRDVNIGRLVTGITYDLFEPLVLNEFKRLAAEVEAAFGPEAEAVCGPRQGPVGHRRCGGGGGRGQPAPRRSVPRVPAVDRGGQAPVPDLEAGALRGRRQRVERGLQPVPCGQRTRPCP